MIFAGIAIESIIHPLALLISAGANPTRYFPVGLVPDMAQNNPVDLLGANAPLTASLSTSIAMIALAMWAGVLLVFASFRFSRSEVRGPG